MIHLFRKKLFVESEFQVCEGKKYSQKCKLPLPKSRKTAKNKVVSKQKHCFLSHRLSVFM